MEETFTQGLFVVHSTPIPFVANVVPNCDIFIPQVLRKDIDKRAEGLG